MSAAPNARALFAAAREDGPDAYERDAIFRKIAVATGVAAGAAVVSAVPSVSVVGAAALAAETATRTSATALSAAGTATGTAFGMKLLVVGAALGAVGTALGVVLAVTVVAPETPRADRAATTVAPATTTPCAKLAQPTTRRRDPENAIADANAEGKAITDAKASAEASALANANNTSARANPAGDLAEEARLLTAARSALMAGDPARSLLLVQSTRKLSARSLEPEELGLEARALRALGRPDDAAATELVLRRRYPDHALAR
jgi:hypothetical protein